MSDQNNEATKTATQEEIASNPKALKIQAALKNLADLCQEEPQASIICSVCVPASEGEDAALMMIAYVGDTVTQIMQLDHLTQTTPQFLNDLKLFLELRIKRQIEAHGTSGDSLADQMLAKMESDQKPN